MSAAIEVVESAARIRACAPACSRRTKRVIAVDDVTFSVPAGSVLGIVGESGCGKSTLARMILGLLAPTAGTALVDGKRLFDLDRKARARLIQPVFQDPFASLNPRRRIKDIVALPLAAQGTFSRARDRAPRRARFSNASASRPRWASACRRNSPAGSASAPRSRARWCSSRAS